MNASTFEQDIAARLTSTRAARDAFVALPANASGSEVLRAFDDVGHPLNCTIGLYEHVHPDEAMRDASREAQKEVSALHTELSLDREVYERLSAIDPAQLQGDAERRLLEHTLRDFRRSGVDRDEPTRKRIAKLMEELVEIGQEFSKNIASGTRSIEIKEGHAAMGGLPEDFLRSHPEDENGVVTITTDPPDALPFMSFCEREDLRKDLWEQSANRAYPANEAVLERMLAKRYELAQCLGYANWAEYITEDKMIGSAESAHGFVQRMIDLARPRAEAELAELAEIKAELGAKSGGTKDASVRIWDRLFLVERAKQKRFQFDAQELRSYFAYDKVREGVLATSAALYGIEFQEVPDSDCERWHEDVQCYDVLDSKGGQKKVVARFYLDMHPREDKFKHAAMFSRRNGVAEGQNACIPEACLVCNFPKPTADDPALMLHTQVTTFFHEFGHLLHQLFSSQSYLGFSGISTEWDFVEVPSQLYEEWAWDVGVLQQFAKHPETGVPVPEDLVKLMRLAEEYGKGLHLSMQMFYAMLSLTYYDRSPEGLNLTEHMLEASRRTPIPQEPNSRLHASFGHLHGYSALYYTYAWSDVIVKDCVSMFEGDLMNTDTANRYRDAILSRGGSKDARDLVQGFLGREYSFDAFEAWMNR